MKIKKLTSIFLAVGMLLLSMKLPALCAEDLPSAPMAFMVEKGIFQGDETGNLNENGLISRGEFCKIVSIAFGLSAQEKAAPFQDTQNHWAKEYIDILFSNGYVSGVSETEFEPDETVTYEQAFAIILRIAGYSTQDYPYGYLTAAMNLGISDRVPALTGQPARRIDAAQMLFNVLTNSDESNWNYSNTYFSDGSAGGSSGGATAGGTSRPASSSDYDAKDGYFPSYPSYPINTEEYAYNPENGYRSPVTSPLSTFSLDVDTASYSNVRQKLLRGQLPEKGAVRTEEMVNYFDYVFPVPKDSERFSVYTEVAACPWNENNNLAMIALKGYELEKAQAPASNLVFLIDVSGSMFSQNKLPLAQKSMLMLADTLNADDKITIVTYAGSSDVVLDTVSGSEKETIKTAVNSLHAGGSTNGAGGIITAYEKAQAAFIDGGNNRVIICSDGDFNVGITANASLEELISEKAKIGVFLSVLGFGMGNYKDSKMELLADCGNGNYAYIDSLKEAKKVLVDDMTSTIFTIAKDVKLQVEFNPARVSQYRLIGYENRLLNPEDFTDDTKDAGEMGAGHTMVAFYEIVPNKDGTVDGTDFKYQDVTVKDSGDIFTVHLRYKLPDSDTSEQAQNISETEISQLPSENFNFASAVVEFALILNNSEFRADASLNNVIARTLENRGADEFGYRAEFLQLVNLVKLLIE